MVGFANDTIFLPYGLAALAILPLRAGVYSKGHKYLAWLWGVGNSRYESIVSPLEGGNGPLAFPEEFIASSLCTLDFFKEGTKEGRKREKNRTRALRSPNPISWRESRGKRNKASLANIKTLCVKKRKKAPNNADVICYDHSHCLRPRRLPSPLVDISLLFGVDGTRNFLTFVNTTDTKILRLWSTFCPYAIAVVSTNVGKLRAYILAEAVNIYLTPDSGCKKKQSLRCKIIRIKNARGTTQRGCGRREES